MTKKDTVLFVVLKIKAYFLYSLPLTIVTILCFHNLEGVKSFVSSIIINMVALHLIISEDSKENHINLKHLIMRKRHFIQKKAP